MISSVTRRVVFALALIVPLLAVGHVSGQIPLPIPEASPGVTVLTFARNLSFPRGLRWGPDGLLYVAEAGPGGDTSTVGLCEQVPGPPGPGPWTGGDTGRVSSFDRFGNGAIVSDNFPSALSADGTSQLGPADVEFYRDYLHVLGSGGGCSHGHPSHEEDNLIYKIFPDGTRQRFVNISDFVKNFETANPEPDDFEPDGTPYSMVTDQTYLYVVEPNHGQVIRIDAGGNMSRLVDLSAIFGHYVPTASTVRNGNLYVGNLGTFPIQPGRERIVQVDQTGNVQTVATGLTTVLGVQFSPSGELYVLEMSAAPGFPTPGEGKIVRVTQSGGLETIVSGLTFPTAMTFGPDGNLYVSHIGFGIPAGEILKIFLPGGSPF